MYKPLADSTLHNMTKKEIIELLRIAEYNAKISQEWVTQQAENIKDWTPVVHGQWNADETCSLCGEKSTEGLDATKWNYWLPNYCPHCGAKMDGGVNSATN